MMNPKLEKLKEVLYVLAKNPMSPRQLELATRLLTKTVQEIANKQLEISENTKKAIAEVLSSVSEQNKATGGQIEASVGSLTGEIDALKAQNQEVLDQALATLEKVNSIKVKDGKDADEDVIVAKVLKLIKIPEPVIIKGNEFDELSVIQKILAQIKMPEPFMLTGEEVVNEINKLPVTEDKQIDAAHIKNLPEVIGRGGGFGIREAPKDGKTYGRKDRDWEEITPSASTYASLTDVNMTGLADGNVPIWDDTTGKWLPGVATSTDEKVKLNSSDPTAGYLDDKITGYGFLTAETDPLSLHLDQTTPQTFTGLTDGSLSIKGSELVTTQYAHTYFVSKLGADTNNGTSEGTSFLTIGKALENCVSGDLVKVLDGEAYEEHLIISTNITVDMRNAELSGEVVLSSSSKLFVLKHYPSANDQTLVSSNGTVGSGYTCFAGQGSENYTGIIHFKPSAVGGFVVADVKKITVGDGNTMVYSTAGSTGVNIATTPANFSSDKAINYGTPADLVYGDAGYCQWSIAAVSFPVAITYNIGTGTTVSSYKINGTTSTTRGPKNWILEGKLGASAWETIDTQTDITWTSSEEKTFTIATPASYDQYRITVSSSSNADWLQIADIGLLAGVASVGGDIMISADILSLGEDAFGILSHDEFQRVITNINNIYQETDTEDATFIEISDGIVSHRGNVASAETLWTKTGGTLIWNVGFSSGTQTGDADIYTLRNIDGVKLDQTTPQTFTGGTVTGSGILKVTAGLLGLDTSTYLTAEADTLQTVTDRGAITDKDIVLGVGTAVNPKISWNVTAPATITPMIELQSSRTAALTELGKALGSGFFRGTAGINLGQPFYMMVGAAAGNSIFGSAIDGDGYRRFRISSDGQLNWGNGAVVTDTVLYRGSPGLLATDGSFKLNSVSGTITLSSGTSHLITQNAQGIIGISGNYPLLTLTDSNGRISRFGGWAANSGSAYVTSNAYFDGANWQRDQVDRNSVFISFDSDLQLTRYRYALAGANPITPLTAYQISNGGVFQVPKLGAIADSTTAMQFFKADGTTAVMTLDTTNARVGIGTTAPSAKLHSLSTTEQLRLGYNASNYLSATVGSTGNATLALTGTTPIFTFSQAIKGAGGFQSSDGTAGLTATKVFNDGAVVNTVTIKNGLITAWTQI